jgi:hypothetical protein
MQDFIVQLEALLKGLKEAANAAPQFTHHEVDRLSEDIARALANDWGDFVQDPSFDIRNGDRIELSDVNMDEDNMKGIIAPMISDFLMKKVQPQHHQ